MNIPHARIISSQFAQDLISESVKKELKLIFDPKKHQLLIEDNQEWLAKIYLPWTMIWSENRSFGVNNDSHYSLALIRAGQAVAGYFHQGILIDHKVFRAYMVRQKQGKSQIKHLKTKGKSRSGSRIRLAETTQFFEDINERLTSYSKQFPIDLWGISCAKTMWPFYFSAAIPPPFSPKAEKLIEVPFHVSQGSFEELKSAGELLLKFHLILSEKGKESLSSILDGNISSNETDDW